MAFDQTTRNRLNNFVSEARALLTDEFARQLQSDYGIDPGSGRIDDVASITHLDDRQRETARILRGTLHHYTAGKDDKKTRITAIDRIVREQAFTVLNRLAALRMAEARGLLITSIADGVRSDGFQLYQQLAGVALGETDEAYVAYIFSLFDEFAVDLPVLFDRFSPQGRLFPSMRVLRQLLGLINDEDITPLWVEDETIGWIYQYFNSKEERKKMRDESSAPRNSREMAVRNQFFTPRYVVEFLTDNTLGRIWYEMSKGETRLVDECRYLVLRPNEVFLGLGEAAPEQEQPDDLTQEELLNQTVYILHRPRKDPREIKMLDPACGSMHFGLYAFDLFETIYEEAWEIGKCGEWAEAYRDKASFMRDVPRLIIENNIHGIDIDARAVQIAGLSLWLRAQRSWQEQGTPATERPAVTRSNVVVAESMPGDEAELDAFLSAQFGETTQDQIVAGLVRRVFEAMKLAGEAGPLLKIEEEIAKDIAAAQEKWTDRLQARQASLFERPQQAVLPVDTSPVSEERFWEQVEARIYAALEEFAEQAAQAEGYRRRLFSADAARGFAFIDLCRDQYDVVLMNPPFGLPTDEVFEYLKKHYPLAYVDVYASFVERGLSFVGNELMVGVISPRTFLASKRMTRWRERELIDSLNLIADFGLGVMDDAMVRSCAYILQPASAYENIVAYDIRGNDDASSDLLDAVRGRSKDAEYSVRRSFLRMLPSKKILYFVSPRLARLMISATPFEPSIGTVRKGLTTFNDNRYLRLTWEADLQRIGLNEKYQFFAKGGEYSNFHTLIHLVVNRGGGSRELCATNERLNGQTAQVRQGSDYYFRPGSQYTSRSKGFSARAIPEGCVMSSNAPLIISTSEVSPEYILGWVNSRLIRSVLEMQSMADDFVPGTLKSLPWLGPNKDEHQSVGLSAAKATANYRQLAALDENEPYFIKPFWTDKTDSLQAIHTRIRQNTGEISRKIRVLQSEITTTIDNLYGFDSENLGNEVLKRDIINEITYVIPDASDVAARILSYSVGVIYSRFDITVSNSVRLTERLQDVFAPLPICPPGMLQNADGLPASPEDVPPDYPLRISWSGIMVDDDGHPEDIVGRVREALHVIWGEKADGIEAEACILLGVESLREYFGNPNKFFADHLSRYSKSRRVAPIYWPLTTTNGSYTLWLYYHRLDAGTLYQCINDFVDPKLATIQRQLNGLHSRNRNSDDERELERLTDLTVEMETFRKDLLELARFWHPNLNDGVEITAAPLYALFGNRKWRDRLEDTWGKLQDGEYDWAHLAMSIWPSRVVPKCVEDRSLAIAHDIENLFWVEEDASWRPLRTPTEEEAHQIKIRQSEERIRLRTLFADLAAAEEGYLPAMQIWQSLDEGEWDHRPLGLHLYPERAAEAAFDDASLVFPHLAQQGQKLLQKNTQKNKKLLTKRLIAQGTPELVTAVEGTLSNEPSDFTTLWRELERGDRDELPLALALWPERVIGKALRDPNLASQHGLFDFFWYDEPDAGVRRRQPIKREIAHEVERRGGDRL